LTRDEGRCYLALLAAPRLTARALSAAADITRGRIYDVVAGLVAKGAAVEIGGTVRSFEALPPSVALSNLLETRRREIAELEAKAEGLVESLTLTASEADGFPSVLEVVRHRATLRRRCGELERAASEEILFLVCDVAQLAGDLIEETRALARGLRLRALYESSLLEREYAETIRRFVAAGGEARHTLSLPMRLTILDRAVTMLPMEEPRPDARSFTVLVVHHHGLSQLAASAFEREWERAAPVTFPPEEALTG